MSAIAVDRHQRMRELNARANHIRQTRAADKLRLRDRTVTVDVLLEQPEWETASVYELLLAQHRWGRARALRLLNQVPLNEIKLCGELTQRQRGVIASLIGEA